ncbi:MAG: DUF5916 domain-containing protein [Gemmatimonadota bacterium]
MLFLIAALQMQASPPVSNAPVSIPRIEAKIAVDGRLDEPVWSQAARLTGFRQYEPVDGRPAEEQTDVLVWYAPDAIHFGIIAKDREPGTIRATRADRDNITGEDHVLIYLDTFNDRRRAFLFAVNALGVQADGVRTEGASSAGRMFGGSSIDYNVDYIFDSKGQVTTEGYVVEVRVPFKTLRFPSGGPQTWGLQIERKTQRTGYVDTWTDVRRASASYLVQAGAVTGLHDLQRGLVLEAQPFATASANGELVTVPGNPPTTRYQRSDPRAEVGANLKLSFTNIALDGTINPDFSQVESDAGQVTINERFALFFPEKRPFFLEGIELFNVPNQLVYTRQVATPIAGAKVTGKVGPFGIAHLTAVDEDVSASCIAACPAVVLRPTNALFNITRLRSDFGRNSLAGLLITDRSLLDYGEYNRVVAADTRIVFARLYYVEAQVGGSWTRDAHDNVESAPLWKLDADRTGRRWGFHYGISGIPDDFYTRSGFVPRRDIVTARGFNRLSFYGKPGALLEQYTVFVGPTYIWGYDDFGRRGPLEGTESVNNTFRLRGGWNTTLSLTRAFYELDPATYTFYQVQTPSGPQPYRATDDVSGPIVQLQVSSPVFRRVDANITVARGMVPLFLEGREGNARQISGTVSVRPTGSIRIGWQGGVQQLRRSEGETEFGRTLLSRWKLEYQPTRALFFRGIADYRAERRSQLQDPRGLPLLVNGSPSPGFDRRSLRFDGLISFEPRPGTVAFLGYGSGLSDDASLDRQLERVNDGFFVKLAYQFRR